MPAGALIRVRVRRTAGHGISAGITVRKRSPRRIRSESTRSRCGADRGVRLEDLRGADAGLASAGCPLTWSYAGDPLARAARGQLLQWWKEQVGRNMETGA